MNDLGRHGLRPAFHGFGIDPHQIRKMVEHAGHPDHAGLLVPMLDGPARLGDLIGAHGRVPDKDHLVVRRIGVDHIPGGGEFLIAAPVVAPDALVDKIVKIMIKIIVINIGDNLFFIFFFK